MKSDHVRALWKHLVDGEQPVAPEATVRSDTPLSARASTLTLPALGTVEGIEATKAAPVPILRERRNAPTLTPDVEPEAQPSPPALAGASQFELLDEVGRGGMGAIFRGRQLSLDREVAVKKALRPDDVSARERFVAEARVTAYLEHPNIVPVHELGRSGDDAFLLVMKLVGGQSWEGILHPPEGTERPDLERSLGVLIEVCDAVAYAHSRGIVHCDLKPENVMVGEFGEVLLMDWGIAVDVSGAPASQARGFHPLEIAGPTGTPMYMAPEQALGEGQQIGPHTDVYLLGSILYEIVTGRAPHTGDNLWATVMRAASGDPPVFSKSVPKPLRAICARAMAREPEARYSNVHVFQSALRAYLRSRESRRFLVVCTVFVSLLAILGAVVGLLLYNQFALEHSQDVRYHSFSTAMELQKSSDDLTSMARTYVMTGDSSYEQKYHHILAVRNGTTLRADGTQIGLKDRMKQLGFSEREFALLARSENNSNALVTTEEIAMNAVKGRFQDATGAFTVTRAPDLPLAQQSMFDESYRDAKRAIMAPINDFVVALDERTARTVRNHVRLGYGYLFAVIGILLVLMSGAVIVTLRLYRRVHRMA